MGFRVIATSGTHAVLQEYDVDAELIHKISEGRRPNINDFIANHEIGMIINTPSRKGARTDEGSIRARSVMAGIPLIGTITGARAAVQAIAALRGGLWSVGALQDYFPECARSPVTVGEDSTSETLLGHPCA